MAVMAFEEALAWPELTLVILIEITILLSCLPHVWLQPRQSSPSLTTITSSLPFALCCELSCPSVSSYHRRFHLEP
jgi:hypothetical protein